MPPSWANTVFAVLAAYVGTEIAYADSGFKPVGKEDRGRSGGNSGASVDPRWRTLGNKKATGSLSAGRVSRS